MLRALLAFRSLPLPMRMVVPMAIASVLWWSSSVPRDAHGSGVWRSLLHNLAHVFAFAGLGASCWLLQGKALTNRRGSLAALALAVTFGLLDELHQRHVVGRSCSAVDLVSDAVGAGIAVAILERLFASERLLDAILAALGLGAVGAVCLATWGPW